MKNIYLIDVGSSTIKLYNYKDNMLNMIDENSIYFKNGFTEEYGLSEDTKKELYDYFNKIKSEYHLNKENTKIYATGIFRKLSETLKLDFINEFKDKFDLSFNIISHDMENFYLEKAMEGNYNNKKVLIINMGGKTTELVTIDKGEVVDRVNIDLGVAELLNKFPEVNKEYAEVKIEDISNFTKEHLTNIKLDDDYDCAIFTGGELRFEKLTGYNLIQNTIFDDMIHPCMVTFDDFIKGNNKIFYEMTMDNLYKLMPHNPKWMDGARPGAVLPQAIFEICNIKYIIPSDLNLINGVIKHEFNK